MGIFNLHFKGFSSNFIRKPKIIKAITLGIILIIIVIGVILGLDTETAKELIQIIKEAL